MSKSCKPSWSKRIAMTKPASLEALAINAVTAVGAPA